MDPYLNFNSILKMPHGIVPFLFVFLTSLIGSLHCVGMCGPLIVYASSRDPIKSFLYHLGRLMGYLLLGSAFGWLGQVLLAGPMQVVNVVSSLLVGFLFLMFSFQLIFKGGIKSHFSSPLIKFTQKLMGLTNNNTYIFSYSLGLLTPLMPCGWLYGFAVAAMATENPLWGGLLMVSFWLGTLPLLLIFGMTVKNRLRDLTPKLRYIVGISFFIMGIYTLSQKFNHLNHNSMDIELEHSKHNHHN